MCGVCYGVYVVEWCEHYSLCVCCTVFWCVVFAVVNMVCVCSVTVVYSVECYELRQRRIRTLKTRVPWS